MQKTFFIKGMVCGRCISSVRQVLENLNLEVLDIQLGEATVSAASDETYNLLDEKLKSSGFELLHKKPVLVNKIKCLIAEVYSGQFDFPDNFRFSKFSSKKLGMSYDTIAAVFSSHEQSTIEKYIIDFRIKKIKELLVYTDDSLTDISFALGFSGVSHLSKQFKMYTGLSPSFFKALKSKKTATTISPADR